MVFYKRHVAEQYAASHEDERPQTARERAVDDKTFVVHARKTRDKWHDSAYYRHEACDDYRVTAVSFDELMRAYEVLAFDPWFFCTDETFSDESPDSVICIISYECGDYDGEYDGGAVQQPLSAQRTCGE